MIVLEEEVAIALERCRRYPIIFSRELRLLESHQRLRNALGACCDHEYPGGCDACAAMAPLKEEVPKERH